MAGAWFDVDPVELKPCELNVRGPLFITLSEYDPANPFAAPKPTAFKAPKRRPVCMTRTRRVLPRRRGAGRPQAARSSARSGDSGSDDPGESPPWLAGHGDIEGIGDPPPDPIPNIATLTALSAAIDELRGFEVVL